MHNETDLKHAYICLTQSSFAKHIREITLENHVSLYSLAAFNTETLLVQCEISLTPDIGHEQTCWAIIAFNTVFLAICMPQCAI